MRHCLEMKYCCGMASNRLSTYRVRKKASFCLMSYDFVHMYSLKAIGTSDMGGLAGLPMHDPRFWLWTFPNDVKTLVVNESSTSGTMSLSHIVLTDFVLMFFLGLFWLFLLVV